MPATFTVTGSSSDIVASAFVGPSGFFIVPLEYTTSLIAFEQFDSGHVTRMYGAYRYDTQGALLGGTVDTIDFDDDRGTDLARLTGIGWDLEAFENALFEIDQFGNFSAMAALFSLQDLTFDATRATAGYSMVNDFWPILELVSSDVTALGSHRCR